MKKYIHLFSFYVHASQQGVRYIISKSATISEDNYRNILLGTCLRNMGIQYKAKDFVNIGYILDAQHDSHLKIGRIVSSQEHMSHEEIAQYCAKLGHNLASVYITESEIYTLMKVIGETV